MTPNIPDFNQWIDPPIDYEVNKGGESSFSINKANKAQVTKQRFGRFNTLQMSKSRKDWKSFTSNRVARDSMSELMSQSSSALSLARVASKALAPIAIMATAMEVGNFAVQASYDRTMLQEGIKGGLDLFVSEAPQILSFAVFGAAEKAISGKLSGGSATGFLGKRFGGGGIKGKAIGFAGGIIAAGISSSLLKPIQEAIGGAIAGQRTSGLMASIAKGSSVEMEASIRKMAAEKGITTEYGIKEFASGMKLPSSIREMTTRQIKTAQSQLKKDKVTGGFWDSLAKGKVINWSEESSREEALKNMRVDVKERKEELYTTIIDNNKMIIDWYSRE
jgi:hypothetical protein